MPLTVIRASAGSGKTFTLAQFFLRLLLQPAEGHAQNPAAILATTFTRAAAGEILDRIVRLLAAAVLSDAERAKLAGGGDLSAQVCARVLRDLTTALDRLGISTMDAFFQQAARAFAAEMGLAPGWQPAVDESAEELDRATLRALIARADAESVANAVWTFRRKAGASIHNALAALASRLDLVGGGEECQPVFPRYSPRIWTDGETTDARAFLARAEQWAPRTNAGKPRARWVAAAKKLEEVLAPEKPAAELLAHTLAVRILQGTEFDRAAIPRALAVALEPVLKTALRALREAHDARLAALRWLGAHYRAARDATVFSRAAYTFDDISRILAANSVGNDALYFRLGTKFEHILFDEFQDTSRRQFCFFRPLLAEVGAGGGRVFIVGDEKQAIYGWRGGDRELVHEPLETLGREIGRDDGPDLNRSYRSSPAVLEAVNRTFSRLSGPWLSDHDDRQAIEAAGREWARGFAKHEPADRVRELGGAVALHEAPGGDDEDDGDAPLIETAMKILGRHLEDDAGRTTAILLRRNKLMPRIFAEIRRRFPAADVSGEGGNPLTDSRAVEIILSLFTWLDHPGHTAARHLVLTSGVAGVFGLPPTVRAEQAGAGEARFLRRLRRRLMDGGFAGVVREWVKAPAFRERCTAHDAMRCGQLVEVAREFDRRGPARPAEFVSHIRTRRVERPGGSKIRVMSVHASKGLEFDAVIVLDLDARLDHGGDAEVIEMNGAWHLVPSRDDAPLLGLSDVRDAKVRRDFCEELSVLYVGMTRARCFLDIVLREDSRTPIAELLRGGLKTGDGAPALRHDGAAARESAAGGYSPPEDAGIAGEVVAPPAITTGLPGTRATRSTPSSTGDGSPVLVSRIFAPASRAAMRRGELIHAWLARITWIEDGLPSAAELLAETVTLRGASHEGDVEAMAAALLSQIADSSTPLHRALSRPAVVPGESVWLWIERPFAVADSAGGRGELLTGCFDRVVLHCDGAGTPRRVEILDFKTDAFRDEAERAAIERHYEPQLSAYRRALGLMLPHLPEGAITSSLCFVR